LNFTQRQNLIYDKGQASFEVTPVRGISIDDLDRGLLAQYAEAVAHPDSVRLLQARNLMTAAGDLTTAAVLLFGSNPQRSLPEAYVRVLRYQGTERGTGARQRLVDDVLVEGPIPRQLARAREVVFSLVPTRRALLAGRFERLPLIPEDAWLEGLVNAVVHRSYSLSGDHIRIEIFDDRIEIESPGRFPGLVDPRQPRDIARFARNPRITRVCADLHFGQELGEGIRRIFDEMHLAGLADPEYRQTAGSVRLTLSCQPVDRELEARLPPGARELLRAINDAGRLSTGDAVDAIGQSRPSVLRHLRALQAEGLIRWVGRSAKDPRAYWTRHIE
ncbi:MAG: winged helix-turn-helix transcriptional regulator, partial [Gemmatimonadetes bacterium]|nr:winged helix-turn-helix transcriptional regulator [Gemmatimonadota bacterium]